LALTLKPDNAFLSLGVAGLNGILGGGISRGSTILVMGNPGSGKTIFSSQFLYEGAMNQGQKATYISFSENREDYFANLLTLDLDMESLEKKGLFQFLDFPNMEPEGMEESLNVMMNEITKFGTERLVIDSVNAITQNMGIAGVRIFTHIFFGKMIKSSGITTLIIGELPFGESKMELSVVEFVVDGVIMLRSNRILNIEKKELVIAKMRGQQIDRSVLEYTIERKNKGIGVIALPKTIQGSTTPSERLPTGIEGFDRMLHGGVFNDSITLIEGSSGIGKTTLCLQFCIANASQGKKALFLSFEEPLGQIQRHVKNYNIDLSELGDRLVIESYVPESLTPLQYYSLLRDIIEKHKPSILAIDSITAIQHTYPESDFIIFMRYLQLLCKEKTLTVFITSSTGTIENATRSGVSSLADNIILMQYYALKDRMAREILIIKTRGSPHEKRLMTFEITDRGIVVQT